MTNTLSAGGTLTGNQKLVALNGRSYLIMQLTDGNLVIYRNDTGVALWATGTNNGEANTAILQQNGNLEVLSPTNVSLWSSDTAGNPGAYLVLDDWANLILYSASNAVLWSTQSAQWNLVPSTVAAHAIWSAGWLSFESPGLTYAEFVAPGWEYALLLNGEAYADAPFGLAQTSGLQMTNDTIIHVASMSKPVCVTAFVAMLDDWTELAGGVHGTGPLAASQMAEIEPVMNPPLLPGPPPAQVDVPLWLLPALSNRSLVIQLLNFGLLALVPQHLQIYVEQIANGRSACNTEVAVPPGYAGLLTHVINGVSAPQASDDFLPLIQSNLESTAASLNVHYAVGQSVANITLDQLIRHDSALPSTGIVASSTNPLTTIPQATVVQPSDGSAVTCDIWAYLLAFLSQPADGKPGYKNDDYNVLGGVIEACVGDYDTYVYARLFSDPQFAALRRYVTDPANAAWYYNGNAQNFSGWPTFSTGNPFPDYRGFGASGGFYYTANQITQWLHALYTRANVQLFSGVSGPLVSQTAWNMLFSGATPYFAAGAVNTLAGWTTFTHDGGTSVGNGWCAGYMGIAVAPVPSTDVLTAFLCANASLPGFGVPAFNQALSDILQYAPPPS